MHSQSEKDRCCPLLSDSGFNELSYKIFKIIVSIPHVQTRKVLLGASKLDRSDVKKCTESLRLLNSFLAEREYLVGEEITMVDYSVAASIAVCQVSGGGGGA